MFSTLYPHYIQILLIHCILLSKEILPIPNIISKNVKNASQFLKEELCLQQAKILAYLAYLLQSEFQTIICMLVNQSSLPIKLLMSKKKQEYMQPFSKNRNSWISLLGSGHDEKQYTPQVILQLKSTPNHLAIIFRGTSKRNTQDEKLAWHPNIDFYFHENAWMATKFKCK